MEVECIFLAIDPGTKNTGIAIYMCDRYMKIHRIEAYTIKSDKLNDRYLEDIAISHSERIANILKISHTVLDYLREYQPTYICCESPFYNRLRPTAYGPLLELLFALRNVSIEFNPLVPFLTYEPLYVKKAISGKAHADKLMVSTSIHNNPEITDALCNDIHTLSEHAMDAIAVGWTHLKQLKEHS